MIEIPSAVMTIDLLAAEADFFSVGTNDLLQYLLAVDRSNERVAYMYRPLHPAVLRSLRMIVRAAQAANIPCSICGEMAGETEYTPILLGLGFTELSMNAGSIPRIKRLIRELQKSDCEELLEEALHLHTSDETEELVKNFLRSKVSIRDFF